MPRGDLFHIFFMDLYTADARFLPARIDGQFIADGNGAVQECPRDNRAEAFDGKHAIHVEPRLAVRRRIGNFFSPLFNFGEEFGNALAAYGIRFNDVRIGQGRIGELAANVINGKFQELFINRINLREDNEKIFDTQERQYIDVFPRLRHNTFARIDNEKDKIDTRQSGNHIFNKLFMSRHINDTDTLSVG